MRKINYKRLKHQKEFDEDLTSPQLLLTSGFSGGKTYALCMKHLKLSAINKCASGFFIPTYTEFSRDVAPTFEQILLDHDIEPIYHKTEHYYKFPWSNHKTYVITCEKRIRGPNLGFCSINEPGLISYERFKEILGRKRLPNVQVPQINMAGTPEGMSNWLFQHCIKKKLARVIFGSTRDNIFVDKNYVPMLQQNYDSIMQQAYLDGKFINMTGSMFYYAFTREKNCSTKIKYDLQRHGQIRACMDFNVQHMTTTFWYIDPIDRGPKAFHEIVIPNNADTPKMLKRMRDEGFTPENTTIYPDPSGNKRITGGLGDIKIIQADGWKLKFKPKAPGFRERQLCIANLMDKGLLQVHPDNCPFLVKDYEEVEQDSATHEKIKDNPELTHASDGADYMIDIEYPVSGKKPTFTIYER